MITKLQLKLEASTQKSAKTHYTRPRRMQKVNSLCTDIRVLQLRAEYCTVGIPHNTVI